MYRPKDTAEKYALKRHRGSFFDDLQRAAYQELLHDVLGLDHFVIPGEHQPPSPWTSFALFESGGRCVGNIDAAVLPLVLDEATTRVATLRSVAVDPAWRGRGLFRDLMVEALDWSETQGAACVLLFTAEPALYGRFGFRAQPQHAFIGSAPKPYPGARARSLDLADASDRDIMRSLVQRRAPISLHCALDIDADQFLANVAKDSALRIAHVVQPESLIVYETDDELVVVDVVAPAIPDLATIIGALGLESRRVKVLFPPDRLGWHGVPTAEDTGLMIRGATPPAMMRPFMFPPTAEF